MHQCRLSGRYWVVVSTGRRNTCNKSFRWDFKSQGLTWPFVELTRHLVLVGLLVDRQVGPLRKVLNTLHLSVKDQVLRRPVEPAKVLNTLHLSVKDQVLRRPVEPADQKRTLANFQRCPLYPKERFWIARTA
jgi:hypothetical protein